MHGRPALRRGDVVASRYRVEERIGCGGMASVFLAHHVEIGAAVAIKVLEPQLAALHGTVDRFLFEAKASSWVQHPNVVGISDYGRLDNGLPYIVMEHLVGEDLDAVVRRTGPMPWSRVRGIALQICAALQAAHDVGVIHRDVKLQNCFRQVGSGGQDFIKVLDFGIAKVAEELASRRDAVATTQGIVVGTPDYMAPEQGRRGKIDHRADVYSLGVVLYKLLTGRLPFEASHPIEQMAQHLYEQPRPPTEYRPDLDARVEKLILRALEKDPDDRYESMRAFADAIERIDHGATAVMAVASPDRLLAPARGRALAMLASAGLVAVSAIVWASLGGDVAPVPTPTPAIPSAAAPSVAEPAVAAGAEIETVVGEEARLVSDTPRAADSQADESAVIAGPELTLAPAVTTSGVGDPLVTDAAVVEPALAPMGPMLPPPPDDSIPGASGTNAEAAPAAEDGDAEADDEASATRAASAERRARRRAARRQRPTGVADAQTLPGVVPDPADRDGPPPSTARPEPKTSKKPQRAFRTVETLKNPYD